MRPHSDGVLGPIRRGRGKLSWFGAAGLMAMTALISACGSAASAATPPPSYSAEALIAVLAAANNTLNTTAQYLEVVPGTGFGIGSSNITGQGAVDFGNGSGAVAFSPADHSFSMPAVYTAKAAYIKPPAQAKWGLPSAASWLLIDITGKDALTGNFAQVGTELESLNPYFSLNEINWGASAAGEVGTSVFNGEQVTDYLVTISLSQIEEHANGPGAAAVGSVIGPLIAQNGRNGTISLRVSIDSGSRIVSVQRDVTQPGPATLSLSRFGTAVPADPPPATDVVDAAAIGNKPEAEKKGGDGDGS